MPANASVTGGGRFTVRYWGVRGSIPVPGPRTVRYGGNTTCIEVRCDDHVFVIDTGTGARELGAQLLAEAKGKPLHITLMYSHLHLDHVQGFPFFAPIYEATTSLRIHSMFEPRQLRESLQLQMAHPSFPVELDKLAAKIEFFQTKPGESLKLGDVSIRTCPMNHPGGAMAIRVDHRGGAFVQASDIEPPDEQPPDALVKLCQGANYLSYDSTYVKGAEYERYKGWGHSTWATGVDVANAAKVGTFIAFHHDPSHDDAFMDRVASDVAERRPGSLVAWEGMTIDILGRRVTTRES